MAQPTITSTTQDSHFWIITLELIGDASYTLCGTCTPEPGATRSDMFLDCREQLLKQKPEMADGVVTYFSIEPNQI